MKHQQNIPSRLFEIPYYQKQLYPQKDALAYKSENQWHEISTDSFIEKIEATCRGMKALGLGSGDKIALASTNRPEWLIIDYAVQLLGGISVPIYPTITSQDYRYIFKEAEVKAVFAEDKDLYDKVKNASDGVPSVRWIYSIEPLEGALHWETLMQGTGAGEAGDLMAGCGDIRPDDVVTIIYTSGTTGNPKGVMLTHQNILSNVFAVSAIFPAKGSEIRTLSFLPLCHIFERTASFMAVYLGVSIYFAEDMDSVGDNLREVKPHYFSAVPRLLEKTYEKIMDKGVELKGLKKRMFQWAMDLASRYRLPDTNSWFYRKKLGVANATIFIKWREALGGNVQFIVSGAAALHQGIARVFWAARIPILEAYGMTETSPGVCFTRLDASARIGSVGMPLSGVEVKIAEDGEIMVKGPNVMKGYYKQPELTAQVLTHDGWFKTGDIGVMGAGNILTITDRKKEMFKTSGGKYIAPQLIENHFKDSPLIEHIMVVGEGQRYPAALIIPSTDRLLRWCKENDLPERGIPELLDLPEVNSLFMDVVDQKNQYFARFEQIKKFKLIEGPWDIASGELTPTLKLKRRVIQDRYRQTIDSLYN